jgi:hypothetical protein
MTTARECPACGGAMPPQARTGRPRRWCSPRCRYAAHGASDAEMRERRALIDSINAHMQAARRLT